MLVKQFLNTMNRIVCMYHVYFALLSSPMEKTIPVCEIALKWRDWLSKRVDKYLFSKLHHSQIHCHTTDRNPSKVGVYVSKEIVNQMWSNRFALTQESTAGLWWTYVYNDRFLKHSGSTVLFPSLLSTATITTQWFSLQSELYKQLLYDLNMSEIICLVTLAIPTIF